MELMNWTYDAEFRSGFHLVCSSVKWEGGIDKLYGPFSLNLLWNTTYECYWRRLHWFICLIYLDLELFKFNKKFCKFTNYSELWRYPHQMVESIIFSSPIYVIGPMGPDILCLSAMMPLPFSSNSVLTKLLQGYVLEPSCLWLPVLYTIWKLQLVQNFNPYYLKTIAHVDCSTTTDIKEISLSRILLQEGEGLQWILLNSPMYSFIQSILLRAMDLHFW